MSLPYESSERMLTTAPLASAAAGEAASSNVVEADEMVSSELPLDDEIVRVEYAIPNRNSAADQGHNYSTSINRFNNLAQVLNNNSLFVNGIHINLASPTNNVNRRNFEKKTKTFLSNLSILKLSCN